MVPQVERWMEKLEEAEVKRRVSIKLVVAITSLTVFLFRIRYFLPALFLFNYSDVAYILGRLPVARVCIQTS